MTYTLTTRGARHVATCNECDAEIAALPSKTGVIERADKHAAAHAREDTKPRRKVSYQFDDDVSFVDEFEEVRQVAPHGYVTVCSKCGMTVRGFSDAKCRERALFHWALQHDPHRLPFRPELADILAGNTPPFPEVPPY